MEQQQSDSQSNASQGEKPIETATESVPDPVVQQTTEQPLQTTTTKKFWTFDTLFMSAGILFAIVAMIFLFRYGYQNEGKVVYVVTEMLETVLRLLTHGDPESSISGPTSTTLYAA